MGDAQHFQFGRSVVVLHADQTDEFAIRQLDDMRLVIVVGCRPRIQQNVPLLVPHQTAIITAMCLDAAIASYPERLAQVQQRAIGQTHRAVRRVDRDAHRRPPRVAAIVAATHPQAEPLRHARVGDAAESGDVARILVGSDSRVLARIGREPGDEQAIAAQIDDARIAVIQRQIVDDGGRRPCAAFVVAFAQIVRPKGQTCALRRPDATTINVPSSIRVTEGQPK